jgi:hypothetical protein
MVFDIWASRQHRLTPTGHHSVNKDGWWAWGGIALIILGGTALAVCAPRAKAEAPTWLPESNALLSVLAVPLPGLKRYWTELSAGGRPHLAVYYCAFVVFVVTFWVVIFAKLYVVLARGRMPLAADRLKSVPPRGWFRWIGLLVLVYVLPALMLWVFPERAERTASSTVKADIIDGFVYFYALCGATLGGMAPWLIHAGRLEGRKID